MIGKRRKSRRVRLAEAIRRDCDPVAFALGFRHPRKGDWNRWPASRRNVYIRWRDGDYDEFLLFWSRYNRASFWIWFRTSHVSSERHATGGVIRDVTLGWLYAWAGLVAPLSRDVFGPWRSITRTVEVTNECIAELDAFFQRRERGPHVIVGSLRRITPEVPLSSALHPMWGDPDIDPERD